MTRAVSLPAVPRVPFARHWRTVEWEQGDHMLLIAPTKAGKSTLMEQLVKRRGHVVIFVSKPSDDTFKNGFQGYRVIRRWSERNSWDTRLLLWPKPGKGLRTGAALQREVFAEALDEIGATGYWTVVIDEMHWMSDRSLGNLGPEVAIMHHQGRSSRLTMVVLSQRPAWIPKIVYSSATNVYVARTRDTDDLRQLAALGGVNARELSDIISRLPSRHDYLHIPAQSDGLPSIVNVRQ